MTLTTTQSFDPRFEFDEADRLRRALRVSGVGVQEMAEYLEVSRDSVSNWINGRNRPRSRDLRAFAAKTGFPVAWLREGRPEQDSNLQPTDYKAVVPRRTAASTRPRGRRDALRPSRFVH